MSRIQTVKGMRDLLPRANAAESSTETFQRVEEAARRLFARYGYGEVRTPILEEEALFKRGVGEETDMVSKEMFAFADGKDETRVVLRPENTAGAVRAYLENRVGEKQPVTKWYYIGPMFRRERPAKGRYRQFWQIGAELIGLPDAEADAEVLEMLWSFFTAVGAPGLTLKLNSIGDQSCRPAFRQALDAFLADVADQLCEDCRRRRATNPMRVLDCKNPSCQKLTEGAPTPVDSLCGPCRAHYDRVRQLLARYEIPFTEAPRLVRGLDYYTRTAFEITASLGVGAQDAVCGGGRYDGLVKALGGPEVPAIGFAIGLDRLVLVLEAAGKAEVERPKLVYLAYLDPAGKDQALLIARDLRRAGLYCEVDPKGGKFGKQLDRANQAGAALAVISGGAELSRGEVILKDMRQSAGEDKAKNQQNIPLAEVVGRVSSAL
jgi:histidyl-tRNA synthetase